MGVCLLLAPLSVALPHIRGKGDAIQPTNDAARVALCLTGEPRDTIGFTAQNLVNNLMGSLRQVDLYIVSTPGRPPSPLDAVAHFSTELADPDESEMRAVVQGFRTE